MIKVYSDGNKLTPNEFAKFVVGTDGPDLAGYWDEKYPETYAACTERERNEISQCINKQADRVAKLLGSRQIMAKAFGWE